MDSAYIFWYSEGYLITNDPGPIVNDEPGMSFWAVFYECIDRPLVLYLAYRAGSAVDARFTTLEEALRYVLS